MNTKRGRNVEEEYIYVKILEDRHIIKIYNEWSKACVKPRGVIRKVAKYRRNPLFKIVFEYWKGLTPEAVKEWESPTWIKTEWLKRNERDKVWVTADPGEGKMYLRFDYWTIPITIEKPKAFYLMYDKNLYLYEKILDIANWTGLQKINIITDLVDLLRINKIYSSYFDIDVRVNIRREV